MWLAEVESWHGIKPSTSLHRSRKSAEKKCEKALSGIWNTPCTMLCGHTDGVEVENQETKTFYFYGDGWLARVREIGEEL